MDSDTIFIIVLLGLLLIPTIGTFIHSRYVLKKENMRDLDTVGNVMGREVVAMMLREARIDGITVKPTDSIVQCYYYSERRRQIVLSSHSCYGSGYYEVMRASITAMGLVQQQSAYGMIDLYLRMAPAMEWMTRTLPMFIFAGLFCMSFNASLAGTIMLLLWILMLLLTLVMRSVRLDASRRSCEWLVSHGIVEEENRRHLEKVGRYIANYNVVLVAMSVFALFYAKSRRYSDKSV